MQRNISQPSRPSEISDKCSDILLIQCPPWDTAMPPLGIAYLSSYLRKYEYTTSVFDLNISLYQLVDENLKYLWEQKSYNWWADDDSFKKTWLHLKEATYHCIDRILQRIDTKYIGLSVNFAGIKFTSEVIKIIKSLRSDIKIILGGWGCVNEHMRGLFPGDLVDVFVVGEGEETLKEVIETLGGRRNPGDVLGAIFNKDRKLEYKPRPPIMDLDSICWNKFTEFNLSDYKTSVLALLTSRGCISSCSFCNDWRLLKPYRDRSALNVFEEIRYHTENNRVSAFSFKDLQCNGNIGRLDKLCDLIIESGIKLSWDSQAIPRKEMGYELLCKLKKSGCHTLIYGIESFSNNVLKRMRKLFTKEIAEKVLRDTHNAGINTMINIIVGFPGETDGDFRETLQAIERNQKYITCIGAISVCLVNNDCDLDINFQDYGLILPSDLKVRAKGWMSEDGKNNYELRTGRAQKVISLINQLGLSYVTATI